MKKIISLILLCVAMQNMVFSQVSSLNTKELSPSSDEYFDAEVNPLIKKAEQGDVEAQYLLGKNIVEHNFSQDRWDIGIKWLTKAAESNNVEAQYLLGQKLWQLSSEKEEKLKGLEWLKRAAENDHVEALTSMAFILLMREDVGKKDPGLARKYMKRAMSVDKTGSAHTSYASQLEYGLFGEKDLKGAHSYYKKGAQKGDLGAKIYLMRIYLDWEECKDYVSAKKIAEEILAIPEEGRADSLSIQIGKMIVKVHLIEMYKKGLGVEQDWTKVFQFAEETKDWYEIAECYEFGRGVEVNLQKAFEYYVKVLEENSWNEELCNKTLKKIEAYGEDPNALYALGNYYSKKGNSEDFGMSMKYSKNYKNLRGTSAYHIKAFQLWEKAAEKNHVEAIKKIVQGYLVGSPVNTDSIKATEWLRRGAEVSNDGDLLFTMAWHHAKGIGTPIDSVEAVKWYERAAEAGHLTATCNLGWCYQNSFGCKEDAAKAFYWYSVAAEKGNDLAQSNLGYCYLAGYGTSPDKQKAIGWLKKSVQQGTENAFPLLFANHDDPKDCADFFKKVAADASLSERRKKEYALNYWIYTIKLHPELLNDSTEVLRTLLPMMKINGKYFSKEQSHTPQYFVHYEFLCEMLFNPCVSSQDYQAALAWLRSAMKDCSDDLKLFYTELLLYRPELASAPEEGLHILQELAETGNPEYQYQLGKVYFKGVGTSVNKPEAIKWFTLAANNGLPSACAHLYNCYDKGMGCQADPKEAFKWLEKYVEHSGVKVEDLIGEAYLYGKGVEKDVQKGIEVLEAEYSTKLLPYYWENKRYDELLKYSDKALNYFIHASKRPAFYFYKALASWKLNNRKQVAELLGLGWEHIKYNGMPEEWNADELLVMVDGDYHRVLHQDSVQVNALSNKQILALLGFEKKDIEEVTRKVGYRNKTFLIFIKTKNWTEKMNLSSKSSNSAIAELFFDYAQYFEDKDKDAAYKAYDLALKYDPENVLYLNNYAYLLACNREDLEKAESMSSKVIEANPDNAAYLDTHAWALFQQGKYDFAKIYIDKVIEMAITSDELDHAGDIYFHCGLKDKALELWMEVSYPRLTIHDGLSQEAVEAKRKLQDELSGKFVRPSYHPSMIIYNADRIAGDWKIAPLK